MYIGMVLKQFVIVALCLILEKRNFGEASNNHKDPNLAGDKLSTIVHLFEWKFKDVANECERFLSKYGYSGVQVSPVNENIILDGRPWYERYQPLTYKIITRSGNEDDFVDMIRRCNNVGVRIYVDVVFNHMSANNNYVIGTGGSTANPNIKYYPDAGYTEIDFHPTCSINNYQNAIEVRNCELVGLHDLNQFNANVRCKIISFLNRLIDLGVAGFRVDASKHMWPSDLEYIYGQLKMLNTTYFPPGSEAFIFQEVIDQGGEPIKATEYINTSVVTDFKYSVNLSKNFRGTNPLRMFKTWGPGPKWGLLNSTDSLVFVDNHDNQRDHGGSGDFITHKEPRLYKMAVAFMLAWPLGHPRVMSSYYFANPTQGPPHDGKFNILDVDVNPDMTCRNGWACEHRWRQIYNMVGFRNIVAGTEVQEWWDNGGNQIAFCRGNKGFIAFNREPYNLNARLQTCLPPGYYCDIISGSKEEEGYCSGYLVLVGSDGEANIYIGENYEDGVLAIHEQSRLWNPSKAYIDKVLSTISAKVA